MVDKSADSLFGSLPKSLIKSIVSDLEKQVKKNEDNTVSVMLRSGKEIVIFKINDDDEIAVKTIEFEHKNTSALFALSEESDGTRRLLDLIEVLLTSNNEKIYVIDEIDRCLHPQLTYKLIKEYLKVSETSQRQLIVTTHEAHLLDFDLLRRDEIWFVDKDAQGHSSLYSLEAYNERFDKKIDKAYLEGRYGGVPIFSSVFPVKGE